MRFRHSTSQPLEYKQQRDDWVVSGYLSVYDTPDQGGDIVLPGAFEASLAAGRQVRFLFDHDTSKILGPPLTVKSDKTGLFATGQISKTTLGEYVHTLLLDGALDSWSMGYIATQVGYRQQKSGPPQRLLRTVDLYEGSLLSIPMHPDARVTQVKSAVPPLDGLPLTTKDAYVSGSLPGTYEELIEDLEEAARSRAPDFGWPVPSVIRAAATYPDATVFFVMAQPAYQEDGSLTGPMPEPTYYRVPYTRADDGTLTLSEPQPAQITFQTKAPPLDLASAAYATIGGAERAWDDHGATVQAQCQTAEAHLIGFVTRARVGIDLCAKAGRPLSDATRDQLRAVLDTEPRLSAAYDVLRQLVVETTPTRKGYRPRPDRLALDLQLAGIRVPEASER